jgi:L-iditol 2-dehydrogenase
LARVEAALTCGTDAKVYLRGYHARMIQPSAIFGHEAAGTVVEVGEGVSGLPPGTRIVWANSAPCGACAQCGVGRPELCEDLLFWNGAYAEFTVIPARIVEKNLLRLPADLPPRRAAMVEPLACAVRGVEDAGITGGQDVAVIGAGPLGLMIAQLAMLRGARVVVAERRPAAQEAARRLGAEVAPVEGDDLTAVLTRHGPRGEGFPVVIEAVGRSETSQAALDSVAKGGLVNLFGGCPAGTRLEVDLQRFHYQELRLVATFHHTPVSVREAFRLIVAGDIDPDEYVTGTTDLIGLPAALAEITAGRRILKTAVIPG